MKDLIKLGLIGCGGLGRVHADLVKRIPGARFIAFCDIAEAAAIKMRDDFGGAYATTSPEKIFADRDIDAVYICTRHDSHASLAIGAAAAGKHIFIEKPLALRADACEAVAEAVQRAGVHLMPA